MAQPEQRMVKEELFMGVQVYYFHVEGATCKCECSEYLAVILHGVQVSRVVVLCLLFFAVKR